MVELYVLPESKRLEHPYLGSLLQKQKVKLLFLPDKRFEAISHKIPIANHIGDGFYCQAYAKEC